MLKSFLTAAFRRRSSFSLVRWQRVRTRLVFYAGAHTLHASSGSDIQNSSVLSLRHSTISSTSFCSSHKSCQTHTFNCVLGLSIYYVPNRNKTCLCDWIELDWNTLRGHTCASNNKQIFHGGTGAHFLFLVAFKIAVIAITFFCVLLLLLLFLILVMHL